MGACRQGGEKIISCGVGLGDRFAGIEDSVFIVIDENRPALQPRFDRCPRQGIDIPRGIEVQVIPSRPTQAAMRPTEVAKVLQGGL